MFHERGYLLLKTIYLTLIYSEYVSINNIWKLQNIWEKAEVITADNATIKISLIS